MAWTGVARAAVSGITSLFPALLKPLNGEKLNQSNFGAFDAWATNIESLRAASWHAGDYEIPGDVINAYETIGANLWDRNERATSGGTMLWPYWVTNGTSSSNARLIVPIHHPMLANGKCYLKGYKVTSEHVGTVHGAVPAAWFGIEIYKQEGNGAVTLVHDYPAANTSNVLQYEAAGTYGGTFSTGSRQEMLASPHVQYFAAFRNESGADARVGRRLYGCSFVFSKDA